MNLATVAASPASPGGEGGPPSSRSVRMKRSTGGMGSPGGGARVSVTRKGAFEYGSGLSKAPSAQLRGAASVDSLLSSNASNASHDSVVDIPLLDPLANGAEDNKSATVVSATGLPSKAPSLWTRIRIMARFQTPFENGAYVSVVLVWIADLLGFMVFVSTVAFSDSSTWRNPLFATDSFSPWLRILHAFLSASFALVAAPFLLIRYAATGNTVNLDLFWLAAAVVSASALPSVCAEYLYWNHSSAIIPRFFLTCASFLIPFILFVIRANTVRAANRHQGIVKKRSSSNTLNASYTSTAPLTRSSLLQTRLAASLEAHAAAATLLVGGPWLPTLLDSTSGAVGAFAALLHTGAGLALLALGAQRVRHAPGPALPPLQQHSVAKRASRGGVARWSPAGSRRGSVDSTASLESGEAASPLRAGSAETALSMGVVVHKSSSEASLLPLKRVPVRRVPSGLGAVGGLAAMHGRMSRVDRRVWMWLVALLVLVVGLDWLFYDLRGASKPRTIDPDIGISDRAPQPHGVPVLVPSTSSLHSLSP
ncbi:hypothetical protein BC830DRAFT_1169188 [Chytriomyces sp. MP71]|nr:hypothetical protein BC830DRAFT_1169188 [Chytriomyces sp. MP71]